MSGSVTIQLPLKTYLKKYLEKNFGTEHCATRNSWLGLYISDILDKEYRKESRVSVCKENSYTVVVPSTMVLKDGFSTSKTKYHRLEQMIRKVFYNDLYSYIDVSIGNELKVRDEKHDSIIKQNRMRAIEQFLGFFDITEDELKRDSVYRQYQRDNEE